MINMFYEDWESTMKVFVTKAVEELCSNTDRKDMIQKIK